MGINLGDDTRGSKFHINSRINRGYGRRQVAVRGRKQGDPPRWINAPPAVDPHAAGDHNDWPKDEEGKINRWVEDQKPLDEESSKAMLYYASNALYSSLQEWSNFPYGIEGFPALADNPFFGKNYLPVLCDP